jgi:hypothetical protein
VPADDVRLPAALAVLEMETGGTSLCIFNLSVVVAVSCCYYD